MPDHMGVNPLADQGLFRHGLDKTINSLGCEEPFFIGTMLPQGIEDRMSRVCPISGGFQVVLDGEERTGA